MVATLGMALASLGQPEPAQRILQELSIRSEREYVPARCVALLHAYLGNVDTAFQWLEKAREERDPWLPFPEHRGGSLLWIPERLWNDPRWTAFKERLGVKLE
jgi:hypothetical protein